MAFATVTFFVLLLYQVFLKTAILYNIFFVRSFTIKEKVARKGLHMANFYLITAMFIVGSSVIVGKVLTYDFPLFLASGLRFLIASLLLLPVGVYKRKLFCLSRHDWYIIVIMAFCGQVLFTLLLLLGLRYTSGISAGTLTSTTPFFMAIVSLVFLGEKFSFKQLCGLLLAFSSIIFLSMDALELMVNNSSSNWLGNLLILTAVAGEAMFLLFAKKLDNKLSGIEITAILSLLGFLMCLPLAIVDATSFSFNKLGVKDIFAVLYFGAIYTDLAYICWFKGVKKTSGAVASASTAIMPLSAALLSTIFLKESISVWQTIALVTAMGSILVMAMAESRKAKIK